MHKAATEQCDHSKASLTQAPTLAPAWGAYTPLALARKQLARSLCRGGRDVWHMRKPRMHVLLPSLGFWHPEESRAPDEVGHQL